MERILVTGGGGFIGSHLAKYLYDKGHFVRCADVKYDDYIKESYCHEKLLLDLRDLRNCLTATQGIDKVYSLAANMGGIGFITSVSADVLWDNLTISNNMIEAAYWSKVRRIFYSSSACVYPNYMQGESKIKGLKESDAMPADPNEAYGWEKMMTEQTLQAYQKDKGLDIRIARYHNIYGEEGTFEGGKEK